MSVRSSTPARRLQRCIELLEVRQLLAVQFNIAAGAAPPGRTDIATGMVNGNTETAIAVDRSDPIQLAISNQGALITTQDFGANFNGPLGYGGIVSGTGLPGVGGDPDLTFDSQGRLFWTNLAQNGTPPRSVAIAEINPANATQQAGTNVAFVPWNNGNSFDKQSMIADDDAFGTSPYADRVYVVYTELSGTDFVQFSRSTDNGQTFSNPLNLSLNTETNAGGVTPVWPADITVDVDGDVYAAYHYQPGVTATTPADGRSNSDGTSGTIYLLRSTNGGTSFPTKTTPFPAGTADISLNVQSVPGTIPNHRFWLQGAMEPVVLADPARPGNVYVIAMDDPDNNHGSGDDGDIVIARSTNSGSTWARSTISAGPGNSLQCMPTAAIDEFGTLVVAWYDDRNGTINGNGDRTLDVRATYSTDGGLTWVSSFQLNDVANPITPVTAGTNVRFFGADLDNDGSTADIDGDETFRFGEYFDIDVFGGTAYVVWNGNTFTAGNPTNHQAWFQSFAIDGSLSVTADEGSVTDSIVIQSIATNGDYFEVLVDGNRQYAGLWESISSININAGDGNDAITINDLPSTCNAIVLGGEGNDTLNLGDDDFDTQIRGDVLMSGGNGTDRAVLNDSADSGNDTWRIDDDTFSKVSGTGSLIAQGGTEQVIITGSNGAIDYRVGSLASAISVTIFGGTGADELFLADTTHDIDTNVAGNLFFGAGTGTDRIWFDDEADGLGSDSYTIGGTSFVKTLIPLGAIDYSSVELLNLVASPNSDTINVENIASTQAITINAGNGNDTIAVGAGDFDNEINGPVSVLGEAGDDLLRINDSLDTLADDYTISSGDFTKSSEPTGSIQFKPAGFATLPDIDRIELVANNSANDIFLNGLGGSVANPFPNPPTTVSVDVTIVGGDGDDRMYIADSGKLLASLRGNITVTGTGGNDELFINDFNSSSNDIHTLSGADYSKNTWSYDVLFSAEELTLQTGTGNDQVNATNVNAAVTLLGGAGNDDYSLEGNYAGIATVVDGAAGLDDIDVNLDGVGSTLVSFINNQDLDLLNIGDGGLVSLAPTHLLLDVVGTLIGGKIDLSNGAMIDRDTALVNPYRTHIINGYNGGNWLGGEPAITSSYAAASVQFDGLGYGYAQEVGTVPFNFLGTPVNNGDLLIRYTLYGDANLSGVVNSIDFNLMVAGYGMTSNADWTDGDSDYNRKSNTIDFNFLAGNFGAVAPGPIFGAIAIEEAEDDSVLA